jgi:hypothetical protein
MRRTKAAQIYRKTGNLRAVQLGEPTARLRRRGVHAQWFPAEALSPAQPQAILPHHHRARSASRKCKISPIIIANLIATCVN